MINDLERAEELKAKLRRWNEEYYLNARPSVSDEVYDAAMLELKDIEAKTPLLANQPQSPSKTVGAPVLQSGFQKRAHSKPMLSLDNAYSESDLRAWASRNQLTGPFSVEPKIDGVSLSLVYEGGKLLYALTRGDGQQGEEVTANASTIGDIPLAISESRNFEVRGEVYMSQAVFAQFPQFANPRNAAAGSLKLLDKAICASRQLSFIAYWTDLMADSHSESLAALAKLGFVLGKNNTLSPDIEAVWALVNRWEEQRESVGYVTDGLVVKVDDLRLQEELGATSKAPRWAIAYKYPPEEAETHLKNILLEVGRTGAVTPVAELEPVRLSGSVVARASLHNFDRIAELDVRLGDYVLVRKAGEIIPEIVAVKTEKREPTSALYSQPTHCPSCQSLLEKVEGEVALRCPNALACPAQRNSRLEHWAKQMDIKGLGTAIIAKLTQLSLVQEPADLYKLSLSQILALEGFQEKSAQKLLDALASNKSKPLAQFLLALGVKHVGENVAKLLAAKFRSLEALRAAELSELESIDGLGPKIAAEVYAYFRDERAISSLERLLAAGLSPEESAERKSAKNSAINGKRIVITGTFAQSRKELESFLEDHGAQISNSVSAKTDYLLAGENAGSKLAQAQAKKVTIISLDELKILTED